MSAPRPAAGTAWFVAAVVAASIPAWRATARAEPAGSPPAATSATPPTQVACAAEPALRPRPSVEGGRMTPPPPAPRCTGCGTVASVTPLPAEAGAGARTRYRVAIRMDDGSVRKLTLGAPPAVGTRVRADAGGRIETAP